jgi:hypothetical protein
MTKYEYTDASTRDMYMALLEGKVSLYAFEKWLGVRECEAAIDAIDAYFESVSED